ncbi:MAG: PilZ domain-containing protein [Bdellovibrionota bacterium]
MFKLFLINRLLSAQANESDSQVTAPSTRRKRNRRIYERYNIDNKHLALMNEQDILLVRDISETGFSTEVSPRGFERLKIGDIYHCRLRYLDEIYELEAKVTWKAKQFVGFEISETDARIKTFLARIIQPLEIGQSLKKVNRTDEANNSLVKEEFQGNESTSLSLWYNNKYGKLKAWQLEDDDVYIGWSDDSGLRTGRISVSDKIIGAKQPWEKIRHIDNAINPQSKQYAMDIIMAFSEEVKSEILESLSE